MLSTYYSAFRQTDDYLNPQLGSTPAIKRIALQTSQSDHVQAAGAALTIEVELHHPMPITGACFSIQIINQFFQPATHVWIYSCDQPYATKAGTTRLRCILPQIRLNVGSYSLKAYFSEPPGGRVFSVIEGVCPFQVVRTDPSQYWGWRPDACVYHEAASWTVDASH